jgi:ureidoglycolate amidohydrolase
MAPRVWARWRRAARPVVCVRDPASRVHHAQPLLLLRRTRVRCSEDSFGTIFGRLVGSEPSLPAVGTGSHTDAIPLSGRFDGVVGVLGGIEAAAALRRAGFVPRRSIDVLMFNSEEPTRFGLSCSGSRAMAGALSASTLVALRDSVDANATFAQVASAAGFGGAQGAEAMLASARLLDDAYASFVELHIEQGARLEAAGVPIGIVTAIAAPAAFTVDFHGGGGHAGALLMHDRHDAGLAAAELAIAAEAAALATGSQDTVATAGVVTLLPGAVNSVPRDAHMEFDVRDIDGERRDRVVASILASAADIAARRGVRMETAMINSDPPATCAPTVLDAVEKAAAALQLPAMRMVSRAYHDTLFIAQRVPSAMIFIPCVGGFSHRPDEFSSDDDIRNGVAVLALTLARLSLL